MCCLNICYVDFIAIFLVLALTRWIRAGWLAHVGTQELAQIFYNSHISILLGILIHHMRPQLIFPSFDLFHGTGRHVDIFLLFLLADGSGSSRRETTVIWINTLWAIYI